MELLKIPSQIPSKGFSVVVVSGSIVVGSTVIVDVVVGFWVVVLVVVIISHVSGFPKDKWNR